MPEITSRTRVAGVIGWPVSHSLSPVIHNIGFRSLGLDIVYTAFAVRPGAAASAIDAMRTLDLIGLSVTMPHKIDVSSLVDEVSPAAATLGSVNTVELREGRTVGHSTDGEGLIASLVESGVDVAGQKVFVVGAGGAARAIVDALARHRAAEVVIANRTLDNALAVAQLFPNARAISLDDQSVVDEALQDSTIVINCTSVGMRGAVAGSPIDTKRLTSRHTVVDLVYHPIETELLALAADRGCHVVDGLGMLVHQAALQQLIWTGFTPDVQAMTTAARAALEQSG